MGPAWILTWQGEPIAICTVPWWAASTWRIWRPPWPAVWRSVSRPTIVPPPWRRSVRFPAGWNGFALPAGAIAVVDYAHTHDALAAVLAACDELAEGRLIVVFGCGGDRDRGKRPLMGEVAARGADLVWITSDNPARRRSRRPSAGYPAGYDEVPLPRVSGCVWWSTGPQAIEAALTAARAGDIVVVAGKGHEDYQLVGDQRWTWMTVRSSGTGSKGRMAMSAAIVHRRHGRDRLLHEAGYWTGSTWRRTPGAGPGESDRFSVHPAVFRGAGLDYRDLAAGELFVALAGEHVMVDVSPQPPSPRGTGS